VKDFYSRLAPASSGSRAAGSAKRARFWCDGCLAHCAYHGAGPLKCLLKHWNQFILCTSVL